MKPLRGVGHSNTKNKSKNKKTKGEFDHIKFTLLY